MDKDMKEGIKYAKNLHNVLKIIFINKSSSNKKIKTYYKLEKKTLQKKIINHN